MLHNYLISRDRSGRKAEAISEREGHGGARNFDPLEISTANMAR